MKDCTASPKADVGAAVTSSQPRALPRGQATLFKQVLSSLEEFNSPYAVAGAFALRAHTGICRYTKDLDVFLTAESASKVLPKFGEKGFRYEVCDPCWLAKVHRNGYFVDLITGMSNGVISIEDSWIARSVPARICGVSSRVLAPEEMLVSKLFVTRRDRFDGADIAHIVFGTRGQLDWKRILHLTGDDWELLLWSLLLFKFVYPGHAEYVPQSLWNDLIERVKASLAHPNRSAKFRGTLIDDAMFAIDVEEWGLEDLLAEKRARCPKIEPVVDRPASSGLRLVE
jgi:hypothetical protein